MNAKEDEEIATATACYMHDAWCISSIDRMDASRFFCALAHSIPFHIFMTCNSHVNKFVHWMLTFFFFFYFSFVLTELFWAAAPAGPEENRTPRYNFTAIFLFGWISINSVHDNVCGNNVIVFYTSVWALNAERLAILRCIWKLY